MFRYQENYFEMSLIKIYCQIHFIMSIIRLISVLKCQALAGLSNLHNVLKYF